MHVKTSALLLLLFLAARPSTAASRSCTAGMVSAGLCAAQTQQLVYFALPPAFVADLEAELCDRHGYPVIVCAAADVNAGRCTASQIGSAVNTLESRAAFANRMLGEQIRHLVRERRIRTAQESARITVSEPSPVE